jgi:phage FluMu protein Com
MQSFRLYLLWFERKKHIRQEREAQERIFNLMEILAEIRCTHCHRLLAKGEARYMEFKCPRCGAFIILRAASPEIAPQDGHTREKCE